MARRRRIVPLILLLLLCGSVGSMLLLFAGGPSPPRLGGPHRIERGSPTVVGGKERLPSGGAPATSSMGSPALHPASLLVHVGGTQDGETLAGARVEVQDPLEVWSGVTDGKGNVPFEGIEAGACSIRASAEGFAEARQSIRVVGGERNEVHLFLGKAPLVEGRVVSSLDGTPVPGAVVHATPNPGMQVNPAEPPSAIADDAGRFRLRAGARGQALTLSVRARGFVPGSNYMTLPGSMESPVAVEVALDPTTILRGRVETPDGRLCPDATVIAYPAGTEIRVKHRSAGQWGPGTGAPLLVATDTEGRYRLEGLAAGGLYFVSAFAPGFAPADEREIWLSPRANEADEDFTLRRGGAVFVKWPVEEGNNKGVASVSLRPVGERAVVAMMSGIATVRFTEVAPGSYEVAVEALNARKRGTAAVLVTAGETTIVEVELAKPLYSEEEEVAVAAVDGLVTDPEGSPIAGVKVGAVPVDPRGARTPGSPGQGGFVVAGRGLVRVDGNTRTGSDGRFRIEGLEEGREYRLLALAQGRLGSPNETVRAPASGIAVVLASLGRLKGRLVFPPGVATPAAIELRISGPEPSDAFRTAATVRLEDGVFDSGDLPPGLCRMAVVAGEFLLPPREVRVPAGEILHLGDLGVVRGAMLTGRVVDSAGVPVPQAIVATREPSSARATTGEDGRFELGPVPLGEAVLSLSLFGGEPVFRTVAASPGGEVGDLVLPREGRLLVRASREDGRPFVGPVEVRGATADSPVRVTGRTDHLGRFSFSLPAREYQVVLRTPSPGSRVLAEARVSLVEGVETRVDLRAGR